MKSNRFIKLLSCCSLFFAFFSCSQNTANKKNSVKRLNVENAIDAELEFLHKKGKLNGNILVLKNEKIIYEKSFGFVSGSKTDMLNKNYRFNIGSIYKEFPAVAIMQLNEKEKIALEDNINVYLPSLPSWASEVKIKELLQYSSGLPAIDWAEYFSKGINVTDAHIIADINKIKKLEFEPGTDYLYTNYSPIVLMKIVEKITGVSFKTYVEKNLFAPYGLVNSVLKEQYPYKNKHLMAIPFDENFKEDSYRAAVSSVLFSATAMDLYNWFKNLDNFKIIKKESLKILSETVIDADNIQSPLGLGRWNKDLLVEHSHHGSTANYECIVRRLKNENITIVILTNQKHKNVYEISDAILDIIN